MISKRFLIITEILVLNICFAFWRVGATDLQSIIEENESIWEDFFSNFPINKKNLLHASFIAYKERMCDLSIESLKEVIASNENNKIALSFATYLLGKNHFLMGNFGEAIRIFAEARDMEWGKFSQIKNGIILNMAITYYRLGSIAQFQRLALLVLEGNAEIQYKNKAKELLEKIK
ncbi:MAG: hypothetical protein N2316_02325 [Spirochaetes bacterium]|nr:hypothetical protein [Spirochaetota bacterium]